MTLLAALLALTLVAGVVDAVSFLGLGHVFTANMTGNVVFLGFSAVGEAGFSVPASGVALGGFLVGALLGGRFGVAMDGRPRRLWLGGALAAEALLVGAAAAVAAAGPGGEGRRWTTTAVLALAMGVRVATVRRLAVPDMMTVILTRTLTGIAADSRAAGGTGPFLGRRVGSVLAMALGAAAGAWLVTHHGPVWPLALAAGGVALLAAGALLSGVRRSRR
ncbi:YoaK family protein [Streptomyces caatingaensis]|uniref:Membrane protein n=1 Tax=Streptomyces caatingaensis TaxID=1678637 RepID=A0A0K9XIR7_9ACTN|nr:YoaK family protein [Streptomyces caatingaensis]KNB52961.1 membrane protein [Streptomyces caatingaensis]